MIENKKVIFGLSPCNKGECREEFFSEADFYKQILTPGAKSLEAIERLGIFLHTTKINASDFQIITNG